MLTCLLYLRAGFVRCFAGDLVLTDYHARPPGYNIEGLVKVGVCVESYVGMGEAVSVEVRQLI